MSNLKKFKDRKGNSTAHLYRDVETDTFFAVIRIGKKIRKKSLETKDYLEALRRLPNALDQLGHVVDAVADAKTVKLLSNYWALLINDKRAKEVRESTLIKTEVVWRLHLEPYLGNWRPDQVNRAMLSDYVLWNKARFPNQQFFNKYKYLSNLLNFMLMHGAITADQIPDFELTKKEKRQHAKKKGRAITADERARLRSGGGGRIRLIVGLCDILGARKMEIGSLQKSRIKRENSRTMIYLEEDDTKTGLARVLAVPPSLEAAFQTQIKNSGQSRFLFPTVDGSKHIPDTLIDRDWVKLKIEAKIQGRLRFHDLRHSRATEFARSNTNPVIACTILGMTLKEYQRTYLNLSGVDLLSTIDSIAGAS